MRATAANVLHGEEREAYKKRPDRRGGRVARGGLRRLLEPGSAEARVERAKASLRAKVEHPSVKRLRYDKVRYRGLAQDPG